MNRTAVFSKTGKGLLEIKNRANKLTRDQYKVLGLVDGKVNLVGLVDRAAIQEIELRKILGVLSDGGYIKEFVNPAVELGDTAPLPSAAYVDDLDFTQILAPGKAKPSVYTSGESERRQREEAERKAAEAIAAKAREEADRRAQQEAAAKAAADAAAARAREEAERRARMEEERREQLAAQMRAKAEAESKMKEDAERRLKEEAERKARIEAGVRARIETERKAKEEAVRKMREEEERRRREEEDHRRQEEEERRRKGEEERRRREEEERRRREEEERRRREEEERRRREEEERRRREEEERRRRENEERRQREEQDRLRREEEVRRQREEQERRHLEEEQRRRGKREDSPELGEAFPTLDFAQIPDIEPAASPSNNFESRLDALKSVEQQIEEELRIKEDAIRQQLEEQERRIRMEEEMRIAVDRAERERREKTDREAKELALAAERARRDAERQSREESLRRAEEEREKRAQAQEDRRKMADEERKRRERERRVAEQRSREEELARRRKAQEEADRRKAELGRIQREARNGRMGLGTTVLIAVGGLAILLLLAIELVPISAYAPAIEKLASNRLGEPVRIGEVRVSILKGFSFKLGNITVGVNQDVKIPLMTVYMDIGALFAEHIEINRLYIESPTLAQEVLPRLATWVTGPQASSSALSVKRVTLKAVRLDVPRLELPRFDADIFLRPKGVIRATLHATDGHLDAEIAPEDAGIRVQAKGRGLVMPMNPGLEFTDFSADAMIRGNQMKVSKLSYLLYGGQGNAEGTVTWGNGWSVDARFEFQRMELETAMKALQVSIPSEGSLDARGRLTSQGASLDSVLNGSRVSASFLVRKGNLTGLDLVRALQSRTREGISGGKTKFDEMSGTFTAWGGQYQYHDVRIQLGALSGGGQLEVMSNQDVNGRAYVALRSSASAIRGNFKIVGDVKGMVLKP